MTRREDIARLIDPSSWRVFDASLASVKRIPNAGYDPDNFKDRRSLALADQILRLTDPEPIRELKLTNLVIREGMSPGCVWIEMPGGEGGDFSKDEIEGMLLHFYRENF